MAFYQTLSEKELQIAPVGLYYVAGDDGAPIEAVKSLYDLHSDELKTDTDARLMARVRESGQEIPVGIEGVTARADGKEILKAWVPIALADAAANVDAVESVDAKPTTADVATVDEPAAPNVEAVACPNCGAALTNAVIQSLTVCPNCGRTIALKQNLATLATSTDTVSLSPDTIKLLKQLRPRR